MKAILIVSLLAVATLLAGCTTDESTRDDGADQSGNELNGQMDVTDDTTTGTNATSDMNTTTETNATSGNMSNSTLP